MVHTDTVGFQLLHQVSHIHTGRFVLHNQIRVQKDIFYVPLDLLHANLMASGRLGRAAFAVFAFLSLLAAGTFAQGSYSILLPDCQLSYSTLPDPVSRRPRKFVPAHVCWVLVLRWPDFFGVPQITTFVPEPDKLVIFTLGNTYSVSKSPI
jgi:hypothetical protein